jgi:hypothetical protein
MIPPMFARFHKQTVHLVELLVLFYINILAS